MYKHKDTIIYVGYRKGEQVRADFDRESLDTNGQLDEFYSPSSGQMEIKKEVLVPGQILEQIKRKLTPVEKAVLIKFIGKI